MKVYIVFDGDYYGCIEIIKAFISREKAVDFAVKEVNNKTDYKFADKYIYERINRNVDNGLKDVFVYTDYYDMSCDRFIGINIIEAEE